METPSRFRIEEILTLSVTLSLLLLQKPSKVTFNGDGRRETLCQEVAPSRSQSRYHEPGRRACLLPPPFIVLSFFFGAGVSSDRQGTEIGSAWFAASTCFRFDCISDRKMWFAIGGVRESVFVDLDADGICVKLTQTVLAHWSWITLTGEEGFLYLALQLINLLLEMSLNWLILLLLKRLGSANRHAALLLVKGLGETLVSQLWGSTPMLCKTKGKTQRVRGELEIGQTQKKKNSNWAVLILIA